jgi:hypothetical protein
VGLTLHNTWVGILLCTVVAMVLAVGYLPRGTCYRHCPMFVSTTAVALTGAEDVEVVAAAVGALALRVLALADEGTLFLPTALLGLSFLVQSVAA